MTDFGVGVSGLKMALLEHRWTMPAGDDESLRFAEDVATHHPDHGEPALPITIEGEFTDLDSDEVEFYRPFGDSPSVWIGVNFRAFTKWCIMVERRHANAVGSFRVRPSGPGDRCGSQTARVP